MKVSNHGLRARVKRLLEGDLRAEDVSTLLLYARDRSDGREAVNEVGDFVAHHTERTKGPVTRRAKGFLGIVHFGVRGIETPYTLQSLPPDIKEFLSLAMTWMPRSLLFQETGLSRKDGKRILPGLLDKLIQNLDGTYRVGPIEMKEAALAECLVNKMSPEPAFTGEKLSEELMAILLKWNLLRQAEKAAFKAVSPFVQIYAISKMHSAVLALDDGMQATLHVAALEGKLQIAVMGPPVGSKGVRISTVMFSTDLEFADYCEPGLFEATSMSACDIEITKNHRLGVLI